MLGNVNMRQGDFNVYSKSFAFLMDILLCNVQIYLMGLVIFHKKSCRNGEIRFIFQNSGIGSFSWHPYIFPAPHSPVWVSIFNIWVNKDSRKNLSFFHNELFLCTFSYSFSSQCFPFNIQVPGLSTRHIYHGQSFPLKPLMGSKIHCR